MCGRRELLALAQQCFSLARERFKNADVGALRGSPGELSKIKPPAAAAHGGHEQRPVSCWPNRRCCSERVARHDALVSYALGANANVREPGWHQFGRCEASGTPPDRDWRPGTRQSTRTTDPR